jgi:hypothetical protein
MTSKPPFLGTQDDFRPLTGDLPDSEDGSDDDFPAGAWDDDSCWDVFLADDEPYGALPEPGDFWIDADRNDE